MEVSGGCSRLILPALTQLKSYHSPLIPMTSDGTHFPLHQPVTKPLVYMKLVEVTRALMTDPDLILLDEPTAGINPTLRNEILDYILKLRDEVGKTFVVIEHDMDVVMNLCERIAVLSEGRTITEGTPDEDEPSAGLAPMVLEMIFDRIRAINEQGVTILMIEQKARQALECSDRGYVLVNGRNRLDGPAEELLASEEVGRAFLGN